MGHRFDTMRAAAYRKKGEDWRNAIVALDLVIAYGPWALVALALGGFGWLLHKAWQAVTDVGDGVAATLPVAAAAGLGAVPAWLWIVCAAVVVAGVALFRPGRVMTESRRRMRVLHVAGLVMLLAGALGFGLFELTA